MGNTAVHGHAFLVSKVRADTVCPIAYTNSCTCYPPDGMYSVRRANDYRLTPQELESIETHNNYLPATRRKPAPVLWNLLGLTYSPIFNCIWSSQ